MANEEITKELEKLRADVAALSQAREQDAQSQSTQETEPAAATPATTPATTEVPGELQDTQASVEPDDAIKSQLEELSTLLHEEIRDLPTITTLVVFSLGILMGRLIR